AGASRIVDMASARTVLMTPHRSSGLRVERDNPAVERGDKQKMLHAGRCGYALEKHWRPIDNGREVGLVLLYQRTDVARLEGRFGGVVTAMLRIAAKLRPIV